MFLHTAPMSHKHKSFLWDLGEQGTLYMNTNAVNGLAMARHRLILCQDGAKPHIDSSEAPNLCFDMFLTKYKTRWIIIICQGSGFEGLNISKQIGEVGSTNHQFGCL